VVSELPSSNTWTEWARCDCYVCMFDCMCVYYACMLVISCDGHCHSWCCHVEVDVVGML